MLDWNIWMPRTVVSRNWISRARLKARRAMQNLEPNTLPLMARKTCEKMKAAAMI